MATNPVIEFVRRMHRSAQVQEGEEQSDGRLLERFVRCRDNAALETLVRRHSTPMRSVPYAKVSS
jgi:hypothetical protein